MSRGCNCSLTQSDKISQRPAIGSPSKQGCCRSHPSPSPQQFLRSVLAEPCSGLTALRLGSDQGRALQCPRVSVQREARVEVFGTDSSSKDSKAWEGLPPRRRWGTLQLLNLQGLFLWAVGHGRGPGSSQMRREAHGASENATDAQGGKRTREWECRAAWTRSPRNSQLSHRKSSTEGKKA